MSCEMVNNVCFDYSMAKNFPQIQSLPSRFLYSLLLLAWHFPFRTNVAENVTILEA